MKENQMLAYFGVPSFAIVANKDLAKCLSSVLESLLLSRHLAWIRSFFRWKCNNYWELRAYSCWWSTEIDDVYWIDKYRSRMLRYVLHLKLDTVDDIDLVLKWFIQCNSLSKNKVSILSWLAQDPNVAVSLILFLFCRYHFAWIWRQGRS